MNFTVEHMGLPAKDTTALKDWYVRVLGGKVIFENGQTPPAYFVQLGGSLMVEIYSAASSLPETGINSLAGWRHLALRVDSIEASRDQLIAKGVTFTDPIKPAGGGGRVLFFSDLEDNLLHLLERPAESIFTR